MDAAERTVKARMPASVRVLGQRFKVQTAAHLVVTPREGDDQTGDAGEFTIMGHTDPDLQVLTIGTEGVGEDRQCEVFLHENLHALITSAALHRDLLLGANEELFVKRLSPILLLWIRDNPAAIAYLRKEVL